MSPGVVCRLSCHRFLRIDLTRFGLNNLVNGQQPNCRESWSRRGRRYCTASKATDTITSSLSAPDTTFPSDVTIRYIRGLPHVTVPLPSRNERCQFALRPISHNVGDFLHMLKSEDRGIDRAAVLNGNGIRIAAACSIESLMDEEFWLHINDRQYLVRPPQREKIRAEDISKISDVRILVAQLYEALNVSEHQLKTEKDLHAKLELLQTEMMPLEQKKLEIAENANRRTNILTWVGLSLMSVQFGIIARLTWWEYSWDIMEPVTYFVTYGTAMGAYAYYCITKQDYILQDVRDRQYLITLHKKAKKHGLDIGAYNNIKREIAQIEHDLRRLRDPLYLHLPPPPPKQYHQNSNGGTDAAAAAAAYAVDNRTNHASSKFALKNLLNVAANRLVAAASNKTTKNAK